MVLGKLITITNLSTLTVITLTGFHCITKTSEAFNPKINFVKKVKQHFFSLRSPIRTNIKWSKGFRKRDEMKILNNFNNINFLENSKSCWLNKIRLSKLQIIFFYSLKLFIYSLVSMVHYH